MWQYQSKHPQFPRWENILLQSWQVSIIINPYSLTLAGTRHFAILHGTGGGGTRRGSRGRWVRRPSLGRRDPRRRRFLRLKCKKEGHWCPLNGCSTPFKHNVAINILKSCKYVFAYVKNRSSPSHIRSSIPWHPPLAEILDPRLGRGSWGSPDPLRF